MRSILGPCAGDKGGLVASGSVWLKNNFLIEAKDSTDTRGDFTAIQIRKVLIFGEWLLLAYLAYCLSKSLNNKHSHCRLAGSVGDKAERMCSSTAHGLW